MNEKAGRRVNSNSSPLVFFTGTNVFLSNICSIGESHQLHKPESEFHPSIVVHIAEEEAEENQRNKTGLYIPGSERNEKTKIVPTKRPDK